MFLVHPSRDQLVCAARLDRPAASEVAGVSDAAHVSEVPEATSRATGPLEGSSTGDRRLRVGC